MVYALVVLFVNSGRGDEHQVAEWIHKAHRFSQRGERRNPLLGLVSPLERMLQAPDAFLPAFEPLLDDEDPWVRALARLQLGKMWIMLGQGGRDADAYLEMALAEFRALGERWGISFALTELADRIATRGEFAGASSQGAVGPGRLIAAEGQGILVDGEPARAMEWLGRSPGKRSRLAMVSSQQRYGGPRRR